jgi:hypothetical protein
MHHEMVLVSKVHAKAWTGRQHRRSGVTIGTGARGNEPIDWRQLLFRAGREESHRDIAVAMKLRQRVRRASIGSTTHRVGAVL